MKFATAFLAASLAVFSTATPVPNHDISARGEEESKCDDGARVLAELTFKEATIQKCDVGGAKIKYNKFDTFKEAHNDECGRYGYPPTVCLPSFRSAIEDSGEEWDP